MKIHNHITVQIPHDLQHRMRPDCADGLRRFDECPFRHKRLQSPIPPCTTMRRL